ncbi:MAG: glycosyltransferase, partial [Gemmatimonadales bacterium]
PELARELARIGGADVVVGIPSFNNASTITHVVRAVSAGLSKYYPDCSCVIVNSDGGSNDGTPEIVLGTDTGDLPTLLIGPPSPPPHRLATSYLGPPGKGSAFRTVFRVAEVLGAKACAVVDSDLRSITPEWIELLVGPVLRCDMDFVAPLYSRHKYDGTITNSIVYPITRALYGRRVRQPIGGDFGCSGRLATHLLAAGAWETDVARFGIDIWMTTRAIAEGFAVCQSYLGAKIHDAKDPGADLSAMFTQVVGTVFELMEGYHRAWMAVEGSADVRTFGFRYTVGVEPVTVNVERMIGIFREGTSALTNVWDRMLAPATRRELEVLARQASADFRFPADVWVRAVYDCAASHHHRVVPRDHLLKAMIPLYLGRTAAFVLQTASSDGEEVQAEIETVGGVFETLKPYLRERWDARPP